MRRIYTFTLTILFIAFSFGLKAQNTSGVQHTKGKYLGLSSPLKEIANQPASPGDPNDKANKMKAKLKEMPNFHGKKPFPRDFGDHILPKNGDPLANKNSGNKMNGPDIQELLVLEGIDWNEAQIWPPDVNGDVGLEYYIQGVNGTPSSLIRLWDKATGDVVETVQTDDLWSEVGAYVVGDIIVLFDRMDNRWILLEISFSSMAIAVSQTSDPLGSYHIYEFMTGGLPDYPKLAAWGDAYYITTNEFDGYNPVYAFDKADLLSGAATVDLIKYDNIPKLDMTGSSFEINAPVDFAGVNDPGDTPLMAIRVMDDEFPGIDNDGLEYYTFKTDFDDPTASVVEGPFFIDLAPYEANLCAFGIFDCLDQKDGYTVNGTDTTFFDSSQLSALQNTIMNRPQYRRFDDYESIVLNFSVDITGDDVAGIRWVELRKSGTEEWSLYQEGTHSMPDGQNRWMGTIAQDGDGNTLLVYTLGGPDIYNSVAYTGRRNSDPLNMMTAEEKIMVQGNNAHPNQRWGDYFAIKTDPLNEDEFWTTAEYVPADQDWATTVAKLLMRQDTIDGAISAFVSPVSTDNLTTTEAVEIKIANPGIDSISNIAWTVFFEGAEIESGVYEPFLTSGESVNIPLTATVDMSVLGDYNFLAYITVADDQYLPNDTLSTLISNLPSFDISTQAGNNPDVGCTETVDLVANYTNLGQQAVSSFIATLSSDGTLVQSVEVTDELAPGSTTSVTFIDVALGSGVSNLVYSVENVNDVDADQIVTNNDAEATYENLVDPVQLTLEFESDQYATEISWELVDSDGVILFSKNDYSGFANVTEMFEMCVPEECYTFNLYDSFGDGWSLNQDAYLTIKQDDGVSVVVLNEPNFGEFFTADFCVPFSCDDLVAEVEYEDASAPGVADAAIYINFPSANEATTYSIDGGVTFQSSPLFTNLVQGTYEVVVVDELGCTYEETINVVVGIEDYQDVEFTVAPNPTEGLFKVSLVGYDGPQEIGCRMINAEGRSVGTYMINKFSDGYHRTMITPDLPAGVYYLSIQNEDLQMMKSVIIK